MVIGRHCVTILLWQRLSPPKIGTSGYILVSIVWLFLNPITYLYLAYYLSYLV
jgi:hypothetical protein